VSRLAAVVLSAALLSGCGVGLHAQTYKESGRTDGTSTDLEGLAIRNLHIEPPASGNTLPLGAQAVLTGGLVNHTDSADTLESISTDVAGSASFVQDGKAVPSVTVPARGTPGDWRVLLDGLSTPLHAGTYVSVTLTFTNAGRTTLKVPVHIGDGGLGSREVNQEPYGEGG
jgi:copper(I)-binding protein